MVEAAPALTSKAVAKQPISGSWAVAWDRIYSESSYH